MSRDLPGAARTPHALQTEALGLIETHIRTSGILCSVMVVLVAVAFAAATFIATVEATMANLMLILNSASALVGGGAVACGFLLKAYAVGGEWGSWAQGGEVVMRCLGRPTRILLVSVLLLCVRS